MKTLSILLIIGLIGSVSGMAVLDACAETRTLTTTITITIKPQTPQVANAPEPVQETFAEAYPESQRDQFVKLDRIAVKDNPGIPRYTMMEKL